MKGLILDMRFDPGGLFSQATEIADMFIDGGTIVSTKGRNSPTRTWEAKKEGTFPNFPMAVIINHYQRVGQRDRRRLPAGPSPSGHRRRTELGQGKRAKRDRAGRGRECPQTDDRQLPSAQRQEHSPLPRRDRQRRMGRDARSRICREIHAGRDAEDYTETYRPERDVLSKTGPPKSDFKDRQLDKAVEVVRGKTAAADAAAQKPKAPEKAAKRRNRAAPAKKARRRRRPRPATADEGIRASGCQDQHGE